MQNFIFLGHSHEYSDCGVTQIWSDNADDRWVGNNECTNKQSYLSYAQISAERTNIAVGPSKHLKSGHETRPKNMVVEWIMKIC